MVSKYSQLTFRDNPREFIQLRNTNQKKQLLKHYKLLLEVLIRPINQENLSNRALLDFPELTIKMAIRTNNWNVQEQVRNGILLLKLF